MTPTKVAMNCATPTRRGFILVTVLVITAVGLLFGAGALLMFRHQCQLRIDRQHELEKVYAVRSALNYIRTYTGEIPEEGKPFSYHTGSDRNLQLLVKPVEAIFPDKKNLDKNHFIMEAGHFRLPYNQYDGIRDYECGVDNWTNLQIHACNSNVGNGGIAGLAFDDMNVTNSNVRWWVNIGMRGTGGWLQEDYGRRYCFWPVQYVAGVLTQDIVRLCIIRSVTNKTNKAGRRYGWPLSKAGERAIVFEISPRCVGNPENTTNNAEMAIYEYCHTGVSTNITKLLHWGNCPSLCKMGVQLADDKASVFYIGNESTNKINEKDLVGHNEASSTSRGYTFSDVVQLTSGTYNYFAKEVVVGGKSYRGIYTNEVDGKVYAPELRAVFEVEASSDKRRIVTNDMVDFKRHNLDFLTDFVVTSAYQYDVFLEHPATVTNRATVAQKIGKYKRLATKSSIGYTIVTYDTHGTEHKGFRRDERDLEKRRTGR